MVPFYSQDDVWAAVHDGVIGSSDVDGNMNFCPPRRESSPLPFQKQCAPRFLNLQPQDKRTHLHVELLVHELRRVETEIDSLKRLCAAQEHLINGFCGLYKQNKETEV